jgi:hypothetical protein
MRMRKLALIALVFVTSAASAAEVACDRAGLLAMLYDAPALSERPQLAGSQPGRLIQFVLHASPLVSDGFRYDGVVDLSAERAWIYESGGIAGQWQWYGPLVIDAKKFIDCPSKLPTVSAAAAAGKSRVRISC